MKIFSALRNPPVLDRAGAQTCLVLNLLGLPGLGSALAGKRTGLLQMLFALAGMGLSIFWVILFIREWVQTQTFPSDGGRDLMTGVVGVLLFAVGWFWSLVTGLRIVQRARTTDA